MDRQQQILTFWFGDPDMRAVSPERRKRWFAKDTGFDREIHERFGDTIEAALTGALDSWSATPQGRLALVLTLDQFTRNAFRDTPRAFAGDERACGVVLEGLTRGDDRGLPFHGRAFHYMPLMHAEDFALQARGVECFARLIQDAPTAERELAETFHDFALQHQRIVDRFGRFPHRNAILGRVSTDEEESFLSQPGSSF